MTAELRDLKEYSIAELRQATNDFHDNHRIGVGTFARVFRGIQQDGTEVAVKVLGSPEQGGFEEEVQVLSKFRHPNLVILMGFAKNGPDRWLVYEHLEGGDVFQRLQRCTCDGVPFTWKQRISVAFDASCGLSHLHNSSPKVFHRDIKCPNILLDRNGTAKMADFGLACCSHAKETKVAQAAGTVGYACPHYVANSIVTERREVYSFGIVLLELLTAAAPATKVEGSDEYKFLVTVLGYNVRTALQMIDRKAGFPQDAAVHFAQLGLDCTEYTEDLRPWFTDVVSRLRRMRETDWEAASIPAPPPAPPAAPRNSGYTSRGPNAAGYQPSVPPQLLQQQLIQMQINMVNAQRAQQSAQAAASGVPSHLRQTQLTQAQEDEIRLQYLTQSQPLRQVSMPIPEMGYPAGNHTTPAFGGSLLAQRGMTPSRPKKMAWTLECLHATGGKLDTLPKEQQMLTHYFEDGRPVPTMRFGRLFQGDFLNQVLAEHLRPEYSYVQRVSREHFQIWAEEWPMLGDGPGPCYSFRLTNYATVGTAVDDVFLNVGGQQAELHNGSIIGVMGMETVNGHDRAQPFLQLRFSLEGSGLLDAEVVYAPLFSRLPAEINNVEGNIPLPHERQDQSYLMEGLGVDVAGGVSFVEDIEPLFILEVGGTAVRVSRNSRERAQLQVLHGPSKSACAAAPGCEAPCPPLVLGSKQKGFWCRILADPANLAFLEPEHLSIEVDGEALERRFFVRNLSKLPLRVQGPCETADDNTRTAEDDGKWQIHHGDAILLNLFKGTSMWMHFRVK